MKTAMQELIYDLTSEIEDRKSVLATNKMYHTSTRILQEILDFYVKPLLQKEKEQIMMAFNDGKINSVLKKRDSEEYYNQTYNQNK
jgi:hypothetical protein